jgi:hypothetical protein
MPATSLLSPVGALGCGAVAWCGGGFPSPGRIWGWADMAAAPPLCARHLAPLNGRPAQRSPRSTDMAAAPPLCARHAGDGRRECQASSCPGACATAAGKLMRPQLAQTAACLHTHARTCNPRPARVIELAIFFMCDCGAVPGYWGAAPGTWRARRVIKAARGCGGRCACDDSGCCCARWGCGGGAVRGRRARSSGRRCPCPSRCCALSPRSSRSRTLCRRRRRRRGARPSCWMHRGRLPGRRRRRRG